MMKNVDTLSFEDALKELEALVRRLEEGKINLDKVWSTSLARRSKSIVQLADMALSQAIGPGGMVLGQMADLEEEGPIQSFEDYLEMSRLKTGCLIAFACEAGAILGEAPKEERDTLWDIKNFS